MSFEHDPRWGRGLAGISHQLTVEVHHRPGITSLRLLSVRNRIEVLRQIGINHIGVAFTHQLMDAADRAPLPYKL